MKCKEALPCPGTSRTAAQHGTDATLRQHELRGGQKCSGQRRHADESVEIAMRETIKRRGSQAILLTNSKRTGICHSAAAVHRRPDARRQLGLDAG